MIDTSTKTPRKRPPSRRGRLADVALTGLLIYAGGVGDAWAYIDPGSGGAIITGILGFLGAIAYTTRKYWYRIKGLFGGKPGDKRSELPPR